MAFDLDFERWITVAALALSVTAGAQTVNPGTGGGGSMVYPGAGVPVSNGTSWGASLATGTSGHAIPFLDGTNTFSATQTFAAIVATAMTVSGLTPGNCVQAGTGGLLTTAAAPCGSGGTMTGAQIQTALAANTDQTGIEGKPATGGGAAVPNPIAGDETLAFIGGTWSRLNPDGSSGGLCDSTGKNCPLFTGSAMALGTTAIAAGACSTAVTETVTGAASGMVVDLTPTVDESAVTGYGAGGLKRIVWPTTNTVNVKVCNTSASSITPGALTVAVRVIQ
jgi:hypothetical protein